MTHANAPLPPEVRRRLARLVVEEGWPVRRAAERFQVSPATASRWVGRYRAGQDLSCMQNNHTNKYHSGNTVVTNARHRHLTPML
mgnify:CR=1 FL=1